VLASLPISERTWYNVLQTYCPTQLSFRRDRLIAIAGLARQLNTITRDEYVAGAWWKSIVDSLCWYRSDTKPLSERDSSYVAPSWSCLSLKDMIQFTFDGLDAPERSLVHIQVQTAAITLASPDRFGAISNATLRLACKWILKCSIKSNMFEFTIRGSKHPTEGIVRFDYLWSTEVKQFVNSKSASRSLDIYILPIATYASNWISRLVILPVEEKQGVYERVGCTMACDIRGNPKFVNDLESGSCDPVADECINIDVDSKGSKRFIIELV
jgi:hypothetical protein